MPGPPGDFNPIHWNADFAESVGLPGVIAHGMFTMGAAVQLVTDWTGDPSSVIDYQTRFTKPVVVADTTAQPGEPGAVLEVGGTVGRARSRTVDGADRPDGHLGGQKVLVKAQAVVRLHERAADRASLAGLTTAGVGGPPAPSSRPLRAGDHRRRPHGRRGGEPLLILAGGSNLIIADEGFDGTVVRIASTGFTVNDDDATCGGVMVKAQAGQDWDGLVEYTVLHAFSGSKRSPGSPAPPVRPPSRTSGRTAPTCPRPSPRCAPGTARAGAVKSFTNFELRFGYRDSLLKQTTVNGSPRYVVLTVEFQLGLGRMSSPVKYAELARALGVEPGKRAHANDVRREVLRLRAAKGMVLDPQDRDTFSTGSFFTTRSSGKRWPPDCPRTPPRYPVGEPGKVKLSAAWLIDRAGFAKGFGLAGDAGFAAAGGRAALSTKHTLAVTNRGGATAADILAVAGIVADGVEEKFGIRLHPEPLLIGCALPAPSTP
jgi:UDP-N-acetylmuramate dehydrogenase